MRLKDGRQIEHLALAAKGDPEAPLTEAELTAKFLSLIAGSPYAPRGDELIDIVTGLDGRPSVGGLLALDR